MDGALTGWRKRRVDAHLERCAGCRDRMSDAARAQKAASVIRTRLDRVEPRPEAFAAMMARIRSEASDQTSPVRAQSSKFVFPAGQRRLTAWSAVAAAVLVVALALPLLLGEGRSRLGIDSEYKAEGPESVLTVAGGTQNEVAPASTNLSPWDEKGADSTNVTDVRGPVLDTRSVRTALSDAGIAGEPYADYVDEVCTLAVWLPQGQDIQAARSILATWVEEDAAGCENATDIAIMEGETPIPSDDSPENHRLREALALLPPMEASLSDTSGTWLILTWRVEN